MGDRSVTLSHWSRPDGESSALTEIPVVEDEEFSPPEAFEDLEPDEQHFHEATGNEGASFERTYRRAALVLWPRDRLLAVINQAGLKVTLPYLADLVERWAAGGGGRESPLWAQAHDLSEQMVATWPTGHWYPRQDKDRSEAGRMLDLLTRLEDLEHIEAFLAEISARGGFDLGDSGAIAGAIHLLPRECAAALMERLVRSTADWSLAACAALLAQAVHLDHTIVRGAATSLVDALPDDAPRDTWRRGPGAGPEFVVDLCTALTHIDAGLADRAASHMLAWPRNYGLDKVLIPAVRGMILSEAATDSPMVGRLRAACVAHLEARTAEPLEAPRDWRRDDALGCSCVRCTELGRFLADPGLPRWVLKAGEHDRSHVESTIRNSQCDVDVMTERKGRPYSLVCAKNQASYERRRVQRRSDLADLERLNG